MRPNRIPKHAVPGYADGGAVSPWTVAATPWMQGKTADQYVERGDSGETLPGFDPLQNVPQEWLRQQGFTGDMFTPAVAPPGQGFTADNRPGNELNPALAEFFGQKGWTARQGFVPGDNPGWYSGGVFDAQGNVLPGSQYHDTPPSDDAAFYAGLLALGGAGGLAGDAAGTTWGAGAAGAGAPTAAELAAADQAAGLIPAGQPGAATVAGGGTGIVGSGVGGAAAGPAAGLDQIVGGAAGGTPWADLIRAGTGIGGALIQTGAAKDAAQTQANAARDAIDEQRRQFDVTQENQRPFRQAGYGALDKLTGLSTNQPSLTAADVMAEPGYQFGLTQGRDAREGGAAARGGLYSGNTGKALTQFGTDYGASKFNDAFNRQQTEFGNRWGRLAGLAGIGQSATNLVDTAGANRASTIGSIGLNNAANQGGSTIAQGNIWGDTLNNIGSGLARWWEKPPGKADGGPVRVRVRPPVVGTVEPLPAGQTSGGLSSEAILQILREQTPETAPAKYGIGALKANPVTQPGRILQERERAAGLADGGPVPNDELNKLLNDMRVNESMIPPGLLEQHRKDIAQRQAAFLDRLRAMDPQTRREITAGAMNGRPMQINPMMVKQIGMADGGRIEPKVGTKSPLPSGGGGLSRAAILEGLQQAADEAEAASRKKTGIAALKANPVTQPGKIIEEREKVAGLKRGGKAMYSNGGSVNGPGGPKDDKAGIFRLSNGEHVLRAGAVTAMGGGSNAKGQRRFSALQTLLDGGTNHAARA